MKQIPGFEEYLISEEGEVFSTAWGKLRKRKATRHRDGYLQIKLYKGGQSKTLKIHRLVASAFLGASNLIVNHIDGIRTNNHLSNLEYTSAQGNSNHKWVEIQKALEFYRSHA